MSELQHYLDNSIPEPNTGCFLWLGAVSKSGYGQIKRHGRQSNAHRVVFALACDEVLMPDEVVRHKCDVPLCINPAHLCKGSQLENRNDAVVRGRTAKGMRNGNARLHDDDVPRIFAMRLEGKTQQEIADMLGVDRSTIGYILRKDIR